MSFQFAVLNDFKVYFNIGKNYSKIEATLYLALSAKYVILRKIISAFPDFACF
jgi:hypothetical protein